MTRIKHESLETLPVKHKCEHNGYEYFRRDFLREFTPRGQGGQALVSIYEIPPLKSAYPYHYHLKNEETFYIISGEGLLKTSEGDRPVSAGDLLFFPADSGGAHKLTNTSDTEKLVYIDFDVIHDLDVCIYPDSGKIGVWGKDVNWVYDMDGNVDYYKGE